MATMWAGVLAAAVVVGMGSGVWAETAVVPSSSAAATEPLRAVSTATQALYGQIAKSLILVKIDTSPEAILPQALREEFEKWKAEQGPGAFTRPRGGAGGGGGGGEGGPPKGGRPRGDRGANAGTRPADGQVAPPPPGAGAPGTDPGAEPGAGPRGGPDGPGRGGQFMLLSRFLAEHAKKDPQAFAYWRMLGPRIETLRAGQGELLGVLLENGHAFVPMALPKDAKQSVTIVLPDGTESTATVIGVDTLRGGTGTSILKLDKPPADAVRLAADKPAPGELLMAISAGHGAMSLIGVPGGPLIQARPSAVAGQFPIPATDDRGPVFLFNADGQLVSTAFDRHAVNPEVLRREIAEMIKDGTVQRRQFGVRYDPVTLGARSGVKVTEVFANSPAEKAGLKVGDVILAIGGRPITQAGIPALLADLPRTGEILLKVQREDREETLKVPAEK